MSRLSRQLLGVLVAFCMATTPTLSAAIDLHELSHGAQHLEQGHALVDADHDDEEGGILSTLHGVHFCGHGVGILPEVLSLKLSSEPVAPTELQDIWRGSAGPDLLFRPPRQS
jgi:hypothetical protein